MNRFIKISSLILCLIIAVSGFAIPCLGAVDIVDASEIEQAQPDTPKNIYSDYDTEIKICSNMGNWENNPENSAEAIQNCVAQYISVDVKLTKDGVPVLMQDSTLDRMCVDKNGNAVTGNVGDYTYDALKEFFLRNRNGGSLNEKTVSKIPSLNDILTNFNGKIFVLDFDISDFEAIYSVIYSKDAAASSRVILRPTGKVKTIISTLSGKDTVPNTILQYNGNIIFSATSLINDAVDSGFSSVQFGTKNHHGVILYNSFTEKFRFQNFLAAFSMTNGYNAKRADNETGWDDVIGRGYNFIETNHPDMLYDYVNGANQIRFKLQDLVISSERYKTGTFPVDLTSKFNKACNTADSLLKGVSSKSQLSNAYTELYDICNELNLAENQTNASLFRFTPGRIIAAVLCLAAVVWAQIFFFKRRGKK